MNAAMPLVGLTLFSPRQELPYHLEQLLDNNRLTRCLLEWEVFGRLFNDDFSIDLLRSWQKVKEVIYQTRETVFHRDIQTPRRELEMRRVAECF